MGAAPRWQVADKAAVQYKHKFIYAKNNSF